jgi:hypothetical protein
VVAHSSFPGGTRMAFLGSPTRRPLPLRPVGLHWERDRYRVRLSRSPTPAESGGGRRPLYRHGRVPLRMGNFHDGRRSTAWSHNRTHPLSGPGTPGFQGPWGLGLAVPRSGRPAADVGRAAPSLARTDAGAPRVPSARAHLPEQPTTLGVPIIGEYNLPHWLHSTR